MNTKVVYSSHYDFGGWGIDKLHPFDGKKFSKAWGVVQSSVPDAQAYVLEPESPADDDLLRLVHSNEYLKSLDNSAVIAAVIEIGMARLLPISVLKNYLLTPIRWATQGTLLATRYALTHNVMVMNLGGGFHHAFAEKGEGFCFFADAALAIKKMRAEGLLGATDTVAMIDLDAHRGNGFESFFKDDAAVAIFDMYNFQVYPGLHGGDVDDFPFMVPLRIGTIGAEYLGALREELPGFLASLKSPKIIFYNAGTDILEDDALGGLAVEFDAVIERDKYVLTELRKLDVPVVVMTSGGYSSDSYKLVGECAKSLLQLNNSN
ncbi:MAG TPA: histone deacetylase [Cellvibrionaceae bacterium]|nr:histone deacetylase [Cellvibrionaceae bacterium]HMW71743.1 histone deacetylase [Cellvibrionaceae bacterium]HNG61003.1 histone deacetylase [Cellvibrionaceae bacterium]